MNDTDYLKKIFLNPAAFAVALGYNDFSKVHAVWMKKILSEKLYVMQAHRNAYKTTAGILALCLLFLVDRDCRVLVVRKTESNAVKILQAIKKLFETNDFLKFLVEKRYGSCRVEADPWSTTKLTFNFRKKVLVEPSISAVGIGTSITGAHFDLIWCDDIVTIDDRLSAAERERTKMYLMELKNILDPSGRLVFTGTPWHRDDAFSLFEKIEKYPLSTVPVLWYKKTQTEKELKKILTPSLFAANYLLQHIEDVSPEFPPINFAKFSKKEREKTHKIMYVDPAFGGKDFTAAVLAGSDGQRILIFDAIYEKKSIGDLWDFLESFFWESGAQKIFYEENSAQKLVGDELRRRGVPCEGVKNVSNKYARIVSTLKPAWGDLYFSEHLKESAAIEELKNYSENSVNDDFTDAVASAVKILREKIVDDSDILDVQRLLL